MSYCRKEGKDKIIFVTESDHAQPSKVPLPDFEDEAEYEGLIKANGEINWECPCLGGMATGVCGESFKSAFSCFHVSQSEPKGSECIDQFRTMQECFNKYPDVYGEFESVDEDEKHDKELFNGEDDKEMDGEIEQRINDEIELSSQDENEVQLSPQVENEVQLSSQDENEVQLSSQDENEVQLSSQDENEVQLSPQVENEVQLSPQDENEVQLSSQDENEVQLSPQVENEVQLSPQDENEVQLSSQDENEVQLSPQDEKVVQESKKRTVEPL